MSVKVVQAASSNLTTRVQNLVSRAPDYSVPFGSVFTVVRNWDYLTCAGKIILANNGHARVHLVYTMRLYCNLENAHAHTGTHTHARTHRRTNTHTHTCSLLCKCVGSSYTS